VIASITYEAHASVKKATRREKEKDHMGNICGNQTEGKKITKLY